MSLFFFFSSRRRHTRWPRDWSSDVCSSDLQEHRYRLEPGPGVRASFQQAAQSLEAAVQYLQQHGDEADRRPIATLVADHQRYLETVRREFAAVDAGD